MIGLSGAHRTGKTTLASEFVKQHEEFALIKTSASQVFKDMGLDPAVDYPFDVRMDVQERILGEFEKQYRSMAGRKFIADRTPIDMLAYTLADVRQNTLNEESEARLKKYAKECFRVTNEYFAILIVVQPSIAIVAEPGKSSLSPMYIEHVAQLVMGLTVSEEVQCTHFYVPKRTTDLKKRVECVDRAYTKTVERHDQRITLANESGQPIIFH